jgi:hypothetical protein
MREITRHRRDRRLDKVAFPGDYAKGVKYPVVDWPTKQVHWPDASAAAVEAARKGEPLDGTVLPGALYIGELGDDGNPLQDPDKRFVAGLRSYAVTEKRAGWGGDPGQAQQRVGLPRLRRRQGPIRKSQARPSFERRKPQATRDFVFSCGGLKTAEYQ